MIVPGSQIVVSDIQGNFTWSNRLERGQYQVIARGAFYDSDTQLVDLKKDTSLVFKLNALPQFEEVNLTSLHITSFIPPDEYQVEIGVLASDGDTQADIQTVYFEVPDLAVQDTLVRISNQQARFAGIFSRAQLNITFIEELQGIPFYLHAVDLAGGNSVSAAQYIYRVINTAPRPVSPDGSASLPINFTWQSLVLPFDFTYSIEIYPNSPISLPPVVTVNQIERTATTHTYSGNLPSGSYYWVLYIVDEVGNRSRSRQVELTIP